MRPGGGLDLQFEKAKKLGESNGYRNISREILAGLGHDAFGMRVIEYFSSFLKKTSIHSTTANVTK